MESDQLTIDKSTSPSQTDLIVQRLLSKGLPSKCLETKQLGLVQFVKENKMMLREVVSALLPGIEEVQLPASEEAKRPWHEYKEGCREGIRWAQWLMFEEEPEEKLREIQQETGRVRGVCGAVWVTNDIAYKCRTCENDPTCAICVPCFEAGNHVNHDYSMLHTKGGCCDCGDITAWKESGFCSEHRGPRQIPSLPKALLCSLEPVLEAILVEWATRLQSAEKVSDKRPKKWDDQAAEEKVATQTSAAMVAMLLNFCNCSESMLTLTGGLMTSDKVGLLDILLRSECFLPRKVVVKLHELLFKLLGDSNFKYQFAKAFISYYPRFILDAMNEGSESAGGSRFKDNHHTFTNFSVQIFTVPTLTPRLVVELRLLDMLLETLKDVCISCAGEDGQLLVGKGLPGRNLYYRIIENIIEDIQFAMRHLEVARYVAQERPDISKAWLHLLAFTQGMDPQRRQTNIHVEEETDNWISASFIEMQMASIHPLFVDGAVKSDHVVWMEDKLSCQTEVSSKEELDDEIVTGRHVKIGRISWEGDVLGNRRKNVDTTDMDTGGRGVASELLDQGSCSQASPCTSVIPAALLWLMSECVSVLDTWLLLDASRETSKSKWPSVHKGVMQRRGMPYRARGGRGVTRDSSGLVSDERTGVVPEVVISTHGGTTRDVLRFSRQTTPDLRRALDAIDERAGSRETGLLYGLAPQDAVHLQELDMFVSDLDIERAVYEAVKSGKDNGKGSADWWMGSAMIDPGACLGFIWSDREWLDIDFDVSRQEISFHIPLHRFLALALQKSLEICATSPNVQQEAGKRTWHSDSQSIGGQCFLMQLFPRGYQVPSFVSFLMEHPLRLQVFCAQVRAGMWRRNGHSVQTLCDHYHSVKWCEKSSDLDLFLLQCCGVMAPPEEFVERILSRFGLADYFSSFLLRPNEFETSLAQQMLSFLIRIVAERSFCGLSTAQSSRRELVRRLAISDAPHSQLMKSLPPRLLEDKQWQEALQSISTYYKPSGMQQGRYSLREECWRELDLYHPRWSARELQCAEDRYFRARKVSAVINQLPKWQKPFPLLQSLSRIATCGKVHDILRSVFFHAAFSEKLYESRAPEGVLIAALHLLALGLDVCSLFAYEQDMIYKSTNMHSDFSSGLSAVSPTHDAHEPPPLLAKATEKVYMGGADGREVSSRQSLLSLLVILMQRHHTGESHGVGLESHQCSIADLIKSLLEKFANLHHECMYAIEYLAPEILHRVSSNVSSKGADLINNEAPDVSEAAKKRMLARERQAAIMAKMKAAQEKFAASIQPSHEGSDMEKSKSKNKDSDGKKRKESRSRNDNLDRSPISVGCALCRDSDSDSPTSFLTFVQRSRLLAIAEKGIPSWERKDTSGKPEASSLDNAVEVGAGSGENGVHDPPQTHFELWNMVQMALIGEMEEVETLFAILRDQGLEYTDPIDRQFIVGNMDVRMSETSSSETGSDDLIEEENNEFNNGSVKVILSDFNHCDKDSSSKEENEKKRESSIVTVLLEYVNILSRSHKEPQEIEKSSGLLGLPKKRPSPTSTVEGLLLDSLGSDDRIGVHMSSCGHAVHQECLDRYLSSLSQRYHSRTHFEGLQIVNPDQGEFLCPVCRRFANSVLPFFEGSSVYNDQNEQSAAGVSGHPSCSGLSAVASSRESFRISKILQVPHALYLLHNAEKLLWKSGIRKAVSKPLPKTLKAVFDYLFSRLCGLYFSDKENISKTNSRVSHGLLLWDVLRYTLMSAEFAARIRKTGLPTKAENPLDALWKEANLSKGSILLLLLRAAKAIQNQNRQSVLLRARGMQLLVGSICFGVSKDSLSGPSMPDNVSKVLQLLENGREAADIQFWRRTADPVLAHDPFSSLVWLVFCLPLSFPSSVEPFISLVHLLYLVCVTQTIAFMGESLMSDLQLSSSAKAFVQSVVTSLAGIYLYKASEEENFVVPSGPVLIVLRRFTLAYLRRCALLQKLLFHVPPEVVLREELKAEKMKPYEALAASKAFDRINNESRQAISDALEDLKELEDLEQRFSLPSLNAILEEESNQEVVLRWCQHWSKEAGSRKIPFLPRPVMAAPFKLMELPPLYQTLLQRYIKERCLVCSTVPEEPALCLLCGTLCCAASRHPCSCSTTRQSECYKHAMTCGGGVGVYLMIRKTNVLLQRCARHASWQSPYLDAFGEEDIDMTRGKPLYLNEERYATLTAMVVSHGLDHSSLVLSHTTRETVLWG